MDWLFELVLVGGFWWGVGGGGVLGLDNYHSFGLDMHI